MRDDGVQTRARIRDAAHIEFAAHGLAGGRVDRIAKAAGANVQRIYAYHSDKQDLFMACVLDAIADLDRAVGDDVADVVTLAARMFDHIAADSRNLRILTWARLEIEDDLRTLVAAAERDPLRRVRQLVDAGEIDPRWTPEDVLFVLISFCEAWHVISTPPEMADTARRRQLVLHLATSLQPAPPA